MGAGGPIFRYLAMTAAGLPLACRAGSGGEAVEIARHLKKWYSP
jgi:hypothetical protein